MSDYNEHSSIYENSDYPSRRQAPAHRASSGGSRQAPGSPKKRRRKRSGGITAGRVIGWVFKALGTLILVGLCTGALVACFAAVYISDVIVPIADLSPDDFIFNEDSIMYYEDKNTGQYVEMTKLLNVTSSVWVDFEEIPKDLINATVAIEDKRFWTHPGVDWRRTGKAVLCMFTGQDIQGGSTITQQLIKNQTNYNETTVKRKVTEIVRAFRFTQNNSKEDTITYYLNTIPLGSKFEGVGAAALGYFGKPVSELSLAECASLIAITNNPSKYGPYSFSKSQGFETEEIWDARQWNKYRQEVVLSQMLKQEMISREEYEDAVAQELVFVRAKGQENTDNIYTWYEETVISEVQDIMADKLDWSAQRTKQAMQRGGLRIYTAYDPHAQAIVDEIYSNRENLDYTAKDGQQMQSTIAIIENETGNLVAIAGKFAEEKTANRVGNFAIGEGGGNRQPGSSFKPLAVYSPALEFNKVSPYSVLDDYPYQLMGGKAWPLNSGSDRYQGHLTVREGLKQSLNTIAVRLMIDYVTPEESFKFVQDRYHIDLEEGRMVRGEWKTDIGPSLSMGGLTDGTNVRDMAEAYSVFPSGGVYKGSRTVTRITQLVDGQEVVLVDNALEEEPAIKETTAWYMNDMMQRVFDSGGTAAGLGIKGQHAAGKTGTTSDNNDRWFVGYTPYYTAAVWVGYENPYKMSLRGKNPAAVLWNKVMVPLHEGLPDKNYNDPGGRRTISYCMDSGFLATKWCAMDPRGSRAASGSIFPESFPEGIDCPYHTAETVITVCADCPVLKEDGSPTGLFYQAGEFCPEESKMEVCLPNFGREQVGGAVAGDAMWDYASAAGYGTCTLHTSAPVVDPGVDPNNPLNPLDPNNPFNPGGTNPLLPYFPPSTGTTTTDPNNPVTQPGDPEGPLDPLPPSENMAG